MMEIEYEPRFLEEAVLRAAAARPEGRLLYREREAVYAIADPEARGAAFDRLNAAWFERLGLDGPLACALAELPLVLEAISHCVVGRPPRRCDAGAELFVRPGARLLRLLITPEAVLAPEALLVFLRRELLHVADMLDPHFGYEPELPSVGGGPARARLLQDRYRAVWDTVVDGRLVRAGLLSPAAREERRGEFLAVIPGPDSAAAFERFFRDRAPTHAAIVAYVTAGGASRPTGACALCGFPTTELEPFAEALAAEAGAEISEDFPDWQPADGCCRQCADLYRARRLSCEGAAALPGIR